MSSDGDHSFAALYHKLGELRARMLEQEQAFERWASAEDGVESQRNLLHYLALRSVDIRPLQRRLEHLGLSSLGRAEAHALCSVQAVLGALAKLAALPPDEPDAENVTAPDFELGRSLLQQRSDLVLGPAPEERTVRILVTLPSEAASDYSLVRDMLRAGMNIARINCAHDDQESWKHMVDHVNRASRELQKPCPILMDLAGPKLRTRWLTPAARVLKLRPQRDVFGRVQKPVAVMLCPQTGDAIKAPNTSQLRFPKTWLAELEVGDELSYVDLRGRRRKLRIRRRLGELLHATSKRTSYVGPETEFKVRGKSGISAEFADIPPIEPELRLRRDDSLTVVRDVAASSSVDGAHIGCTMPEVFACVQPKQRIWFDDGKLGGVIVSTLPDRFEVRITHAVAKGAKLRADKGINLPDTTLRVPFLSDKDRADLAFVAQHASIVALSFVQRPTDLTEFIAALDQVKKSDGAKRAGEREGDKHADGKKLAAVLKIETRRAFEHLPELLLMALGKFPVGVMIARGDLALEIGYERLAEVQEEILWISEAAHVPVIWATSVLDTLAKKGVPTRAEVTDAAMAQRAECVMLNKGPYMLEAIAALHDILGRMDEHQRKKTSFLRPLRAARVHFTDSSRG